jgi:hypothetical protein
MKPILITLAFIISILSAKAQKEDTTIYNGCKKATDTTTVIGNPSILDDCPQFKNDPKYLYEYIQSHINYKNLSRLPEKETRVVVETVIEKDGSVSHTRALQHVSDELGKEAARVINSLPKWHPGVLKGKKVRVRYWVVVSFKPKQTQ